ncbi:MAG TPA: arylesterase [Burkholderiales bacterium]|nr:arylesterase [Burkholderiales bacterium]
MILVLGDSLSAGYGLPQGKGWADLLQQRLTREGYPYRVVNASISGDTTLDGRNRLAGALARERPAIVVLELGANDGLRGQSIAEMRANLAHIIRASRGQGAKTLLVGMRLPPNYGPGYTNKFQQAFLEVSRDAQVPLVPFLLDGFADKRELFQADGIHPRVEAQGLILDNVWKRLQPMLGPAPPGR